MSVAAQVMVMVVEIAVRVEQDRAIPFLLRFGDDVFHRARGGRHVECRCIAYIVCRNLSELIGKLQIVRRKLANEGVQMFRAIFACQKRVKPLDIALVAVVKQRRAGNSLLDAGAAVALCEKVRHVERAADGHDWEIDVFHGKNEGLVVAEVELGSEDEMFERPSWLGEEVTGDKRYYNSCLAQNPYTEWKQP